MCGIAGFYLNQKSSADPTLPARLRTMCGVIRHRGPDDEGIHVDGGVGIGMRRLSIIDLATGHQPISNEDDSVWIVFNGEIYNYQSLRAELTGRHRFKTNSDTETILHLFEEQGPAAFGRLRGMFGIALWDGRQRTLTLARDRFGKKPLYYAARPEGLYFGSELKCLAAAGVPLELDQEALRWYFQFSYIPDPASPFAGVRKLPPGGWLRYHADGRVEQGTFWTLPAPAATPPPDLSRAAAAAQVRDAFDEAVRVRMIADVPLGAFLSGGIDSSSVVASMALQSKEPVRTFSIGFEEAQFNELPYARMVAERYRTQHQEFIVKPDSVELAQRIVHYFDEPFGDPSTVPTFLVSQCAVQHVKVVLTGDGGDEIFGGYESFWKIDGLRWLDRIPGPLRQVGSGLASLLPYSAYGKNFLRMASRPTPLERYFELNYAPRFLLDRLLTPAWRPPSSEAALRAAFPGCLLPGEQDVLTQALYYEATAKLRGDMLVKVDRMSMAQSLEVRCPLLDHELAELAARLPHAWKLAPGRGKIILLEAIGDRLPPQLLNRPKQGFSVPLPVWLRTSLLSFLRDHLQSQRFRQRGVFQPAAIDQLIDEHVRGRRDNSHWLWMILMLELWWRNWESSQR